jgi:hypothetical protein
LAARRPSTTSASSSSFTGGGSKDELDTSNWLHKAGSVLDKDDLAHAYAARYSTRGQVLLYFGADRTANDGDSQIGFLVLQGHGRPAVPPTSHNPNPAARFVGDRLGLSLRYSKPRQSQ